MYVYKVVHVSEHMMGNGQEKDTLTLLYISSVIIICNKHPQPATNIFKTPRETVCIDFLVLQVLESQVSNHVDPFVGGI